MHPLTLLALFFCSQVSLAADLELASPFADHMVVQEGRPIALWGWTTGVDDVQVSWDGGAPSHAVSKEGRWRVELPAPMYGEDPFRAHSISIQSGVETLVVSDILVGEVWLASGQSNMSWPLEKTNAFEETRAKAPLDGLRMFTVVRTSLPTPATDVVGDWRVFSSDSCGAFSAVGTYFGLELLSSLNKPIGIVHSSWGGSRVEAWMSPESLMEHAEGRAQLQLDAASFAPNHKPAHLSNGMLSPLEGLAFAGCIWYQGESNAREAQAYERLFPAMIRDWRKRLGNSELPFYFVQLANYIPGADSDWPALREAQRKTLASVPNTGMAVTIDVGNPRDIHPRNKSAVGARLARLALRGTYEKDVLACAPLPISAEALLAKGCTIHFGFSGAALLPSDPFADLTGFELAGEDGVFHPATAGVLDKSIVVLWKREEAPKHVRYCWSSDPSGENLLRVDGLPVSPFALAVRASAKSK